MATNILIYLNNTTPVVPISFLLKSFFFNCLSYYARNSLLWNRTQIQWGRSQILPWQLCHYCRSELILPNRLVLLFIWFQLGKITNTFSSLVAWRAPPNFYEKLTYKNRKNKYEIKYRFIKLCIHGVIFHKYE